MPLKRNTFVDSVFGIVDDGDQTRQLQFQLSGITTGTTRTLTVPDASGTLALTSNIGMLAPVRVATLGTETFTIASGSVTQIAGTTVDGKSPSVGDRILVKDAPVSTGAGSPFSTQPGNGIYTVTNNTTNLSVSRAGDMSGSVVPAGLSVVVLEGTANGSIIFSVSNPATPAAFTYGTTNMAWTGNLESNAYISSTTSIATAASITTLNIASTQVQIFTGSSTQTVKLPTTSVVAGQTYTIVNQSTGAVTVQSSGANNILTLPGTTSGVVNTGVFTAVANTPTSAAHWAGNILGKTRTTAIATPGATPTINTDNCDFVDLTSINAAITSMTTNLSGNPINGQTLMIRFKDDGTARAITWGTSFQSSGIATLLATTVISKEHHIGLVYSTGVSKWVCIAVDAIGY